MTNQQRGGACPSWRGDLAAYLVGGLEPGRPPTDRFETVPDLPWTSRAELEPGSDYLVMASHLPLNRLSATVRFFRAVWAVRKQLATADGLVGYTLREIGRASCRERV